MQAWADAARAQRVRPRRRAAWRVGGRRRPSGAARPHLWRAVGDTRRRCGAATSQHRFKTRHARAWGGTHVTTSKPCSLAPPLSPPPSPPVRARSRRPARRTIRAAIATCARPPALAWPARTGPTSLRLPVRCLPEGSAALASAAATGLRRTCLRRTPGASASRRARCAAPPGRARGPPPPPTTAPGPSAPPTPAATPPLPRPAAPPPITTPAQGQPAARQNPQNRRAATAPQPSRRAAAAPLHTRPRRAAGWAAAARAVAHGRPADKAASVRVPKTVRVRDRPSQRPSESVRLSESFSCTS